jgi:DNA-binding transcriptional ArsR family regulator
MHGEADISAAAALLAEPARAQLVVAVIEHGPLPASELAVRAGVAASTASGHLARLVEAGFLVGSKNGRYRYYDLGDPNVAEAVEALARVAPQREVRSLREATRSELVREARTCYDHLAGRLGVAIARGLERRQVVVRRNGAFEIGRQADECLDDLGIDLAAPEQQRRPLVRACLDWSGRKPHVAGALGAALTARFFELGWIERRDTNRSVAVTAAGQKLLREYGDGFDFD